MILFIIEMLEHLMKTISGRYINKYLLNTSKLLKKIMAECPLDIVINYIEQKKKLISHNIAKYKVSSDYNDPLFRKNYVFS